MKKVISGMSNKFYAVMSLFVFGASMLPIWYLARYARPSGDDYGYSYLTHHAWVDTHSLLNVIKAAVETVQRNYVGWNGDWFTTFLFSLMPEVFVPYSFWIVPFIMTGVVIIGTFYFMYEICVKVIDIAKADFLIYTCLILLAGYQFIPSTAIGMYWYVGATHYMLPHAAGLIGLAFMSKYLRTDKIRYLVGLCISAFMVGGSSYFTTIMLLMVLFAVGVVLFDRKKKQVLYLILPFLVCMICFIIQCIAPGNSVRGGQDFGFSLSLGVYTIFESLNRGFHTIGAWVVKKTFVFVLLLLLAVFGWETMYRVTEKNDWKFPVPIFFIVYMYGIYSAMFAPVVYSEVYDSIEISLGPETIQYFTFLICSILTVLYCEGWIIQKIRRGNKQDKMVAFMQRRFRNCILFPVLLLLVVLVIFNKSWLSNCTDKRVYDYVSSGQAEDFKAQIASQMEILLDDSIKEAYLVPINPEQGPLMHMPVTTDENAFTNRVVRDFYRKDKVVMKKE